MNLKIQVLCMRFVVILAFIFSLSGACQLRGEDNPSLSAARKLWAEKDLSKNQEASKLLNALPTRPEQKGWEQGAYLFAELALKMDAQQHESKVKELFSLLVNKSAGAWQVRGRLGLLKLAWKKTKDRDVLVHEVDGLVASLTKEKSEASADAAFLLGLFCEEIGQAERARASYEHAQQMLKHVVDYFGKDTYSGLLTNEILKSVLDRLKPKEAEEEPLATYRRTQKLQRSKEYAKAIGLYESIVRDWAKHELAQASSFRIQECRYASGEVERAFQNLKDFIASNPRGPWRGHAYLLLADIRLERHFDPRSAEPFLKAIMDEAAQPPHPSWSEVLPDVHDRMGIIHYYREQYEEASRLLRASAKLRPQLKREPDAPAGMIELAEQVEAKIYPVPEWLKKDGDDPARFILFLASAYMTGWKDEKAMALFQRVVDGEFKGASFEQKAYALTKIAEGYVHLNKIKESDRICLMFETPPWNKTTHFAGRALLTYANNASAHGDNTTANKYLEAVYTRYPDSMDAEWAFFGRCFHSFHHDSPDVAIRWYEEFLNRYPNSERKESAQRFLNSCKWAKAHNKKIASDEDEDE